MALTRLLVRVNLAGICFVLGVTEETVLAWRRHAAHQAEAINRHLLRALPVTQVQLDERWNFIARKHACETDEAGERVPAYSGEDITMHLASLIQRALQVSILLNVFALGLSVTLADTTYLFRRPVQLGRHCYR